MDIHKIGIEVEGEFTLELLGKLGTLPGCELVSDGSVRTCHELNRSVSCPLDAEPVTGTRELRIGPVEPDGGWESIFMAMRNGYHWNRSAGLHVHLSFKDGERENVMAPSVFFSGFALWFRERLELEWPEVMAARGNNRYCQAGSGYVIGTSGPDRWDSTMFDSSEHSRYQFLNTLAWRKHRTMEVRIWPSGRPEEMVRMVHWTVKTFQRWLRRSGSMVVVRQEDILRNECEGGDERQLADLRYLRQSISVRNEKVRGRIRAIREAHAVAGSVEETVFNSVARMRFADLYVRPLVVERRNITNGNV